MTVPHKVSKEGVEEFVRQRYEASREMNLFALLKVKLQDPLQPQTEKGHWKPHPLFISLGAIALFTGGAFIYFSFR